MGGTACLHVVFHPLSNLQHLIIGAFSLLRRNLLAMVDHVVLNAFKRFDQDGSGCISREELGRRSLGWVFMLEILFWYVLVEGHQVVAL